MRKVWLALWPLCVFGAHPAADECGSGPGRARAEIFLHRQHAAARARLKLPGAAAAGNQDLGQIAVIDDSGGVIGRRNAFNLDGKTLAFTPSAGGYTVAGSGDSLDFDAASSGALIARFGDDDTRAFALPFAFPYFGKNYQQIWVNSNGFLTFTAGDKSANGSFGYFEAGLPAIAPLFTDLDPSQSSDGVHVLAGAGRFVVTFSQVPLYGSFATETFQVRLYPDGRIEMAYRGMNVSDGVVGISPGGYSTVALVDFVAGVSGAFASGVAEIFASSDAVDIASAAAKFYLTHDDAYDYLVFYNAENVAAGPGIVAYESTVRSSGKGYGDSIYDFGNDFGSPRRLQSVLNLGPLSEYPVDPNAPVPSRGPTGDTPLTILGHEAGHLYLALVSVADPSNPNANPPMLGRGLVHWAFTFNSEASFLEGNRIADLGAGATPRFQTTATVAGYAPLDQYLMGFLPPEQVPPMFAVLNSIQNPARAPQTGVAMDGDRLDIRIEDVVKAAGRRVPDSTVAQRRFRFAFVLIVPAGSQAAASAVAQVDAYRAGFETLFAKASGGLAAAETSLKKSVDLSLAPGAGVLMGTAATAAIELAGPAANDVTFTLAGKNGILTFPASVTIAAGARRATFAVGGLHAGVEEFSATPADGSYETAVARVAVPASAAPLRLTAVSSDPAAVVVRAVDANDLPYSGMRVSASVTDGSVRTSSAVTDERGEATFAWTPGASQVLTASLDNGASLAVTPFGKPVLAAAANSASFSRKLAPGAFVAVGGTNLAGGAVALNGSAALVYSSSDALINFVAPYSTPAGAAAIVVTTAAGSSDPLAVSFDAVAPGIFFDPGSGYGAILIAGTADVTQNHPAAAGTYISIYCTGLGNAQKVTVAIGGVEAKVSYAGPTVIAGLEQVNALVGDGTASGTQTLALTADGVSSNPVKVQIAP